MLVVADRFVLEPCNGFLDRSVTEVQHFVRMVDGVNIQLSGDFRNNVVVVRDANQLWIKKIRMTSSSHL